MVLPLEMGWRHLLFENYPVDPGVVDAHLPEAFDVDTFDGDAWLSVVPFTNVEVRPAGLPAWAGQPLPELNLRTYVTCDGGPGVYFFSLDADGVLAVVGARLFHHLPYFYADISIDWVGGRVRFSSRRRHPGDRPARYEATYWPTGEPFTPGEGSLAAFLVERYRFFTQSPDGAVRHTEVDHEPWTLYPADADVSRNTLFTADGFEHPGRDCVRFYSPGLDVVAETSQRWRPERGGIRQ